MFIDIPYKRKLVLHGSLSDMRIKTAKEYANIILEGDYFKSKITLLEGRSVIRKDIYMGVILGMDILYNKVVRYQEGKWHVIDKGKDNSRDVL